MIWLREPTPTASTKYSAALQTNLESLFVQTKANGSFYILNHLAFNVQEHRIGHMRLLPKVFIIAVVTIVMDKLREFPEAGKRGYY